jgi:membrane associated rhomboid family serine protease
MDRSSPLRRPFRYTKRNFSLYIIAANIALFALTFLFPRLYDYLALNPVNVLRGMVWQPFTYMFIHENLSHLLFNMLGLLFFAPQVEQDMGSKEFLLYYLLTGFLAGLFSFGVYLLTGAFNVFLLGASGCVFAILLAFAVLFPSADIYVFGLLPVRAPILVAIYALIELVDQVFGLQNSVAHLTHLSGLGFGWLYFLVRFGINPARRLFPRSTQLRP